jgi:hypothetical protein
VVNISDWSLEKDQIARLDIEECLTNTSQLIQELETNYQDLRFNPLYYNENNGSKS